MNWKTGMMLAAPCAITVGVLASTEPILSTHDDSLTSFLGGSTSIQDVRPQAFHRGVNLDGSARAAGGPPMALAGNPFGESWNGSSIFSGVRLDTGTVSITDVDLALPAPGFPWVVGRSYNARQHDGSAHHDSDGHQGWNWFQLSQPKIVLYDHDDQQDDPEDLVYIVYGADRYIEFKRQSATSDEFRAVNGAAGAVAFYEDYDDCVDPPCPSVLPDVYIYTDQNGWEHYFFGFDDDIYPPEAKGQFWKSVAPSGGTGDHVAFVGAAIGADLAIAGGYNDPEGQIEYAKDTADRVYNYTYYANGRLQKVQVVHESTTVAKVEYTYYGSGATSGREGDLYSVKVSTALTQTGVFLERTKYYRYWGGWTPSGYAEYDPDDHPGHPHQIKYIVEFEGIRRFGWTYPSASDSALAPYASAYFEYEDDDAPNGEYRRIRKAWFNGDCGCGGAGNGLYEFEYETNGSFSGTSGYDTDWERRTIVKRPDGTYLTQYFDEVGQPLHRVETKLDPDDTSQSQRTWATQVTRNNDAGLEGQVVSIHSPANVTGYTHSSGSFTLASGAGYVQMIDRVASGYLAGFADHVKHSEGTGGDDILDITTGYTSVSRTVGDVTVRRPLVSYTWDYGAETTTEAGSTSGPAGATQTELSYDSFHSDLASLTPKQITTTYPAVSTANNGPGLSYPPTHLAFYNEEGNLVFEKTTDGIINYWQYREEDGVLEKTIEDADTNGDEFDEQEDDCATVPTGFESSGTPDHRVTCLSYEGGPFIPSGGASECACDFGAMGDAVQTDQGPTQVTYRSHLADGRMATLTFPDWELDVVNGDKYYGPVAYTVTNHAGQVEFQGTIALDPGQHAGEYTTVSPSNFIDETKSDPLTAIGGIGSVAQLTTTEFSETGVRVTENRAYFKIPTSGTGDATDNYDPTLYSYDDMGRLVRVKDPTGTIERTAFDERGRVTGRSIGTNDQDEAGTDNMVQTVAIEYDGGDDGGNDLVTEQTLYVQNGSADERVTTFINDFRGRTIVTVGPEPPYVVHKYDNQDRSVAMGLYSSSSGLDEDTDPTATSSSNRVALDETAYDELGRVFKTVRWKINESTGAKDDSLESLTWYDAAGRVIKLDGEQLVKIAYDRLGRPTHQFNLAVDNDSAYADADDVAGDIVLQERQSVYDADTGDVLMSVVIDRDHDDYGSGETTGALDANADGGTPDPMKLTAADLSGRAQITAHWYDNLGRTIATARYGTYGGATFDRADSGFNDPPDQSADDENELVTSYVYYTDGTLKEVKDPEEQRTVYEYDAAGRTTAEIRNYVNGTPSGANGDDDAFTRYTYAKGLPTRLWVDVYPLDTDGTPDSEDQVTLFAYEVTPSDSPGPSKIDANRLLRQITYPDSGIVRFAYNAQSERIWSQDQDSNEIAIIRDDLGRVTARDATVATGFDDRVVQIATAYDSVGRVSKVTQYDDADDETDEVVYTYDGWGNVTKIEQDRNSAVGASGSVDDYEVSFSYAKATTGRNTIRRSAVTLPGASLTYDYSSLSGLHDADASRLTKIWVGLTTVAKYDYSGLTHLVGTLYPAPNIRSRRYGPGGSYDNLDRFNRVITDRWTKVLSPTPVDFYDHDVQYDRSSNVTVVDDHVHGGFDTAFALDGLDRLRGADQGTWNGSTIASPTRQQLWENPSAALALDQLGNWDHVRLDLDGDGTFGGAGEYDDDRTHNLVNELSTQDVDDDSNPDYDQTYDSSGNLIDDGRAYEYVWDAFGRLVEIRDTDNQVLIAEYRYL